MRVRRCSQCTEPAVIVVREWGTTNLVGGATGRVSRTDYRCQSCGAGFRVLPWHGVRAVVGGLLSLQVMGLAGFLAFLGLLGLFESPALGLAMLLPGLVGVIVMGMAFVWSVSSTWYVLRNPVVAGAPTPALRFGEVVYLRRCACGAAAPVVQTVSNTTNGVPTGTDYHHQCATCSASFLVVDVWGTIFNVLIGTILVPLGMLMLAYAYDDFEYATLLMGLVLVVGGLAGYILAARSVRNRILHPDCTPLDSP